MKKFFIGSIGVLLVSSIVYASNYSEAKDNAYKAAVALTLAGYNLKGMKGEHLSENGYRTYTSYLYSGNQYVIVGAGDSSVRDLDVQVYNSSWKLVASDNDSSNVSVAKFSPRHTGTYRIRTKMYSGHGYFFQMIGWK